MGINYESRSTGSKPTAQGLCYGDRKLNNGNIGMAGCSGAQNSQMLTSWSLGNWRREVGLGRTYTLLILIHKHKQEYPTAAKSG